MEKVFNFGMTRTGTSSLRSALKILGYKHLPLAIKKNKNFFERFDAFVSDAMFHVDYKFIANEFPEGKFLLTIRKDSETWFKSIDNWSLLWDEYYKAPRNIARRSFKVRERIRKDIYGYEMPQGHKEHFIKVYEGHNFEIIDFFNRKGLNLHILCWEWGGPWLQLCSVLNMPIPDEKFPWTNSSKKWRRK